MSVPVAIATAVRDGDNYEAPSGLIVFQSSISPQKSGDPHQTSIFGKL